MAWRWAVSQSLKGLGEHERRSLRDAVLPKGKASGDYVAVYVALGLISVAGIIGFHTMKQQLMHPPGVRVKKSRRETLPELVEPEHVVHDSHNFISKSFFRKLASVHEFETPVAYPIHANSLAREPQWESLQIVGVDPDGGDGLHR